MVIPPLEVDSEIVYYLDGRTYTGYRDIMYVMRGFFIILFDPAAIFITRCYTFRIPVFRIRH